MLLLKLLADRQGSLVKPQGGNGRHYAARRWRLQFVQIAYEGVVVEHRLGRQLVTADHGRAQDNRNQALQKPVVAAVLGKLPDRLGLNTAQDRDRKVLNEHRAATDAVCG